MKKIIVMIAMVAVTTVVDTDLFLKYFAVNTVIQNRDTCGRMTRNYFLYHHPDKDKLTWMQGSYCRFKSLSLPKKNAP